MILSTLHQKSPSDCLQRITGNRSTHKVLFNARFREYRIVGIQSTYLSCSDRDWVQVFSGSEESCKSYKNRYHG